MKKISQEPIVLFDQWFTEAQKLSVNEPSAMTVATCSNTGKPSARILLLKAFDDRGFCFYTNLTSRKGKEIAENPNASLCFYWDELKRQVRIEGKLERVSEKEADDYFATRSRGSQIGAWSSKQSSIMDDEMDLPTRIKDITEKFTDQVIPRPPFWSGFRVIPDRIEFWQEGNFRLHTRIIYIKDSQMGEWLIKRLYP